MRQSARSSIPCPVKVAHAHSAVSFDELNTHKFSMELINMLVG
jgi:hypothetical protein